MTFDECKVTKRNAYVWGKFQLYRLTGVLQKFWKENCIGASHNTWDQHIFNRINILNIKTKKTQ